MALTAEQVTILNSSFQPTIQLLLFFNVTRTLNENYKHVNLGLFFPSDIYRGVARLHLCSELNLFFK